MSQSLKIKLDITTFYSSLGLTSTATDADIQKSYRKLARELHPDKSKSESAAELFKVICNAHSILMDKEKKNKYDRVLLSKGLKDYTPRDNCHRYSGLTTNTSGNVLKSTEIPPKTPQKGKATPKFNHRPYEQQPYGFGTGPENVANLSSHSKVPIFQSFNLKNYQRNQRPTQQNEPKISKTNPKFNGVNVETPPRNSHLGDNERNRNSDNYKGEEISDDEKADGIRPKLHKSNLADPFDHVPGSPFANNRQRHYARTKHEARTQERRSVSPVKTTPTSESSHMSESWDSLKNILNNFKEREKMASNRNDEIETVVEKSIKMAKVRKADSQSVKLDELSNSLPNDDDFFDMRKVSHTLDSVPVIKKAKLGPKEESPDIEVESQDEKNEYTNSHQLDRNNGPRTNQIPTNLEEHLYMPVNRPLPKIYKAEVIPLDQYKINSKVMELALPKIPNLQCNILDKSEIEQCKEYVKQFNAESSFLKSRLLSTLSERLDADRILSDKLLKVENVANWSSCKDFDFEIVSTLAELNSRQRIVAQQFATLLSNIYSVGRQ